MQLLTVITLVLCLSSYGYGADAQNVESIDSIRETIKSINESLGKKSNSQDIVKNFLVTAKIYYLLKLQEKSVDVEERLKNFKEMMSLVDANPNKFSLAIRAKWYASINNDIPAAVADIVAASAANNNQNTQSSSSVTSLIAEVFDINGVKEALIKKINELPHDKKRDDLKIFLTSCGLKFLYDPIKKSQHSELALKDFITALHLMDKGDSQHNIQDQHIANTLNEIAEDVGVQQAVKKLRENREITEETETLFIKHKFFLNI